ncbi:MAG: hypothetical protein ACR2OG_16655 [Gemmatimonadaceae bacterium]
MVGERNYRSWWIASVLAGLSVGMAVAGCRADEPVVPPANTGPGATVARVQLVRAPAQFTVGDTSTYKAKAYDNANNELPVAFLFHSSNDLILSVAASTGLGTAVSAGDVAVWVSAGTTESIRQSVHVNSKPILP